jgi:hypothetical protein
MLEACDEHHTGLPFGCLLTQIILQSGIIITGEPKMKVQQPLGKQTLMKSMHSCGERILMMTCLPPCQLLFQMWLPPLIPSRRLSQRSMFLRLWRPLLLFRGGLAICRRLCPPCSSPSLLCSWKCGPSTRGWSRPIWTFRSASKPIIQIAVMMRLLLPGLHVELPGLPLWQRMFEFPSVFIFACCLFCLRLFVLFL